MKQFWTDLQRLLVGNEALCPIDWDEFDGATPRPATSDNLQPLNLVKYVFFVEFALVEVPANHRSGTSPVVWPTAGVAQFL